MKKLLFLFAFCNAVILHAQDWSWATSNGGPAGHLEYTSITSNSGSATFATGSFSGTVNIGGVSHTSTTSLYADGFIIKYQSNGSVAWVRIITGHSYEIPTCIAVDAMGNVVVGGYYRETASFGFIPPNNLISLTCILGNDNMFLAKYNGTTGALMWAKQSGEDAVLSQTNSQMTRAVGLGIDASNNIYVTGNFLNTAFFQTPAETQLNAAGGQYDQDAFVARYDMNGNPLQAFAVGSSSADYSGDVAVSSTTGTFFITGNYTGPSVIEQSTGQTLFKYNNWASSMYVMSFSSQGICNWVNEADGSGTQYPGNSFGIDIVTDNVNCYVLGNYDGNIRFASTPLASSENGMNNTYLVKFNNHGSPVWAQAETGNPSINERAVGLAYESLDGGRLYELGDFNSIPTTVVRFSNGSAITSVANRDFYVSTYRASTGVMTSLWHGATPLNFTTSAAICKRSASNDARGFYVCGSFDGPQMNFYHTLNNTGGAVTVSGNSASSNFIGTTGFIGAFTSPVAFRLAESDPSVETNVYPVPASSELNIQCASTEGETVTLIMYDLSGKEMMREEHTATSGSFNQQLDVSALASGYYLLTIQSATVTETKKIAICR